MANELRISMALEHYDRHMPFLDGSLHPKGLDINVQFVAVEGEGKRHERMLSRQEWDACELSLGSYIMAKARDANLTAIPVFPRRLFSQSQMYVNANAGIEKPSDLVGKRVALRSFQTTLSILAKGDLGYEYDVPLNGPTWVTTADEPVAFDPPAGVKIERLGEGKKLGAALVSGEVSACLSPRPPQPYLDGAPEVKRLFDDPQAEEVGYFKKNGFFPIMHVLAIKKDLAEANGWLAGNLYGTFLEAKQVWSHYMDDPNWGRLAWGRHHLEEERELLGDDPWPYGVAANRANLERFIGYEYDQGLIPEKMAVEDLFFETVLET
ncbi:MAG: 4,5-dihydroxyphthalate decarboxylase [Chloroflexi bacterium]|nr:4,5-dihydroxyphthalate decarboxylase [Chloroflexota bacterium]